MPRLALTDANGIYSGVQACQSGPVETVVCRTCVGPHPRRADLELADGG